MINRIRHVHFIGIGGIGMSGIAEVMINQGYRISGSDLSENANVKRLRGLGAEVFVGHSAQQVEGAQVVVVSSAVRSDNPELMAARRRSIPVVPRAEMLAELMRFTTGIAIAGTHGKTTTTSITATLLAAAGLDPTVVNGGILKAFGSNARLGKGRFLVTEADESDGSFLRLFPTVAVITNIDPEHMEHYGSFANLAATFKAFAEKVPFYGLVVLCRDHPETQKLSGELPDKRVVTYGFSEGSDYRAVAVHRQGLQTHFQVIFHDRATGREENLGSLALSLPGDHNVLNTLAAMAVAREVEIPWATIVEGLAGFGGVERRFDILLDGPARVVIDDYGHHPVEIRAVLSSVREGYTAATRLVVVFQPHRYSRVKSLFEAFCNAFSAADLVLVDQIYAAGETAPEGILADGGQPALVSGIRGGSNCEAHRLTLKGEGWMEELEGRLLPGDVVVFLGAGDVSRKAHEFAARV